MIMNVLTENAPLAVFVYGIPTPNPVTTPNPPTTTNPPTTPNQITAVSATVILMMIALTVIAKKQPVLLMGLTMGNIYTPNPPTTTNPHTTATPNPHTTTPNLPTMLPTLVLVVAVIPALVFLMVVRQTGLKATIHVAHSRMTHVAINTPNLATILVLKVGTVTELPSSTDMLIAILVTQYTLTTGSV